MRNYVVESLTIKHGSEIIALFKEFGVETHGFDGSANKSEGNQYRFYGLHDNSFDSYDEEFVKDQDLIVVTLEQLNKLNSLDQNIKSKEKPQKQFTMQITKTLDVKVNKVKRRITVAVVVEGGAVKSGYSVCMPEDEFKQDLASKIAIGRATNERTNLTPDMVMGIGMDKKFILYAIAEDILKRIERGSIQIKGIKKK